MLNRKGFVSIETIFASVLMFMIIFLAIGFFNLFYPKLIIAKEVHALVQKAKIQGGLTDSSSQAVNSDIELFKKALQNAGFDPSKIEITAKTEPGNINAIGVTPYGEEGDNYIKRDSKELIVITVKVPADQFIRGPLAFFRADSSKLQYHIFQETVMSERW